MSGLTGAIILLTRVPIRTAADRFELARSVPWFPVVGAGIGAIVALVYVAGIVVLPTFVAAALAVSTSALLTGAFHEDGLADVADSFAGGSSVQQRLEILDDPRLGTFGVIALASSLLVRVGAISALDTWSAVALIPAAHALSRVGGIVLLRDRPLANPGGLGAAYWASLTPGRSLIAALIGIGICTVLIAEWAVPAALLTTAAALAMGRLASAKLGGVSGDVLGAAQQVGELSILVLGAAVVHEGWDDLAWWIS